MDVESLLEKLIAQNEIIIRQNEQLLLLIAERSTARDSELLTELRKLNSKLAEGNTRTGPAETS